MDGSGCLTDWHTEVDVEFPLPLQRKHLGLENELMEILWHNGEAVLHRQTNKKSRSDSTCEFNHQADDDDEDEDGDKDEDMQLVPWINSLANETFHKDLCTHLLPQIPASHQPFEKSGAGALTPLLMPPARFGSFETGDQNRTLDDLQFAYKNREVNNGKGCFIMDPSVIMAKEIRDGSIGKVANEVNISMDSGCHVIGSKTLPDEIKSVGVENTPFDGCRKASSQSSDNTTSKRKRRDAEEPESDATELESPPDGNNVPSKKPAPRRRRVAQVHNLSERRRRDRINEKMHALQALIPHSNKRDKASVLDEAIEYMKSLQLQLQWWMGTGMARMMHPRTQQQYMYHAGIGIRQPAFPPMQNVMRLPNQAPMGHGLVLGNRVHQNQMQNGAQPYSHPAPENNLSVQLRNGTANNLKT